MDTWTQDEDGAWRRWSHPSLALDAIASSRTNVRKLLLVQTDARDDERLLAMIRLARRLAASALRVAAAHAHPSRAWAEAVAAAGAEQAMFVPRSDGELFVKDPLSGAELLDEGLCPALHARRAERGTLSVCGRHRDRMVLAPRHFGRWCLRGKHACPYWNGEGSEAPMARLGPTGWSGPQKTT